jgi:hypothetical protein
MIYDKIPNRAGLLRVDLGMTKDQNMVLKDNGIATRHITRDARLNLYLLTMWWYLQLRLAMAEQEE